jgi:hypothetical protein
LHQKLILKIVNRGSKGAGLDFAAELELYRDLRGRGGPVVAQTDLRQRFGPAALTRRSEPILRKDWDAPENFEEERIVAKPIHVAAVRGLKRGRSSDVDLESSDEEEDQVPKTLETKTLSIWTRNIYMTSLTFH